LVKKGIGKGLKMRIVEERKGAEILTASHLPQGIERRGARAEAELTLLVHELLDHV
jgi:hypothetical protein